MAFTAEQIHAELKRIQELVPKTIRNHILTEVEATPTVKRVVEEALASGSTRAELKEKLRALYENGDFSKLRYVENEKFARMADNIVQREIKKSIRAGRLPRKADIKQILNNAKSNS